LSHWGKQIGLPRDRTNDFDDFADLLRGLSQRCDLVICAVSLGHGGLLGPR